MQLQKLKCSNPCMELAVKMEKRNLKNNTLPDCCKFKSNVNVCLFSV